MPIEQKAGCTVITGAASISYYRLCVLKGALYLETKGMRASRGRTAYSVLKQELGLKGNKAAVLAQVEVIIDGMRAQQSVIQQEQ